MGMWSWAYSEEPSVRHWYPTVLAKGWPAVREAVLRGADSKKPDLTQVAVALAAAVIVGAAKSGPDLELPADVSKWIKKNRSTLDPALLPLAIDAVYRAEDFNESNWAEGDETLDYQKDAEELRQKLGEDGVNDEDMHDAPES
jgi:hypothetical protein